MTPPEAGKEIRKFEDKYKGYDIMGPGEDKMGTAGRAFVDEHDGREYVEVQGGLVERALGTGYYLLPTKLCTVDGEREIIRASVNGNTVKNSPYLDSTLDLSSDHAAGVREYYGL